MTETCENCGRSKEMHTGIKYYDAVAGRKIITGVNWRCGGKFIAKNHSPDSIVETPHKKQNQDTPSVTTSKAVKCTEGTSKSKGCGKEGVDDYGNIITCGEGILCDTCSKAKNHSPQNFQKKSKSVWRGEPTEGTSLSDKIAPEVIIGGARSENIWIHKKHVRNFIKEFLKREGSLVDLGITQEQEDEIYRRIVNKINKLAGDDLVK